MGQVLPPRTEEWQTVEWHIPAVALHSQPVTVVHSPVLEGTVPLVQAGKVMSVAGIAEV